ncbi:MAG: L,D-transpeptidase family protein [Verrucomicrobiaceae bacterium]|nr:L,D-transpeptidase family protein [Verrucomicrobiaceae bacterium]
MFCPPQTDAPMTQQVLSLTRRLLLPAAALVLASCASSGGTRGQTQYLEAFAPQSVPHSALYNADQDSYWDGDGMGGSPSITIDLSDQKAYFYKGGQLAGVSALSTGDEKHPTKTGNFKIIQKDQWHKSNLYGDYVDAGGNVVMANIDVTKDKAPPGTTFDGSKMHHFMRFVGGIGMHEGFLPGYPASHGCVRMPGHMAATFYNNVSVGTPVTVRP